MRAFLFGEEVNIRSRNIKPGFFKNEVLASLPPLCRILYSGLWCLADRDGRLEDRSTRIKAEVLPYDECNVEDFLTVLYKSKFINRYNVNGLKYIEIPNFQKHQHPHIKEGESTIPAPSLHGMNTKRTPDEHRVKPPDSLILIPDSPIPLLEEVGVQRFDEFWKCYPKKIGKGYARKIFLKFKPSRELLQKIIEKVTLLKETEQWKKDHGQFIPHPATWLNREGWDDEVEKPEDIYSNLEIVRVKNGKRTN